MSRNLLIGACLLAFVAACAQKDEVVYVEEPVTAEPVYTGKYK
ncbi:hypothetical protein [Frigidibacter oleivorans]|nr:hypothetical protein [Frigidibacter oleivorans]